MITPELKYIHSPDVMDLENHVIPDSEPFYILVQAMFGIKDGAGKDSFDFMLCNPVWLAEETKHDLISGRHLIVAQTFNFSELRRFLENLAKASSAPNWEEVGKKLGRFGHWEFEDYIEYRDASDFTQSQVLKKVVTPELKSVCCPEAMDIQRLVIPEDKAFSISIQAIFCRKNGSEEKSFSFLLCNHMWLVEQTKFSLVSKPHLIIAEEFSFDKLRKFLENLANFSSGDSWNEVCEKLGRLGEAGYEEQGQFGNPVYQMPLTPMANRTNKLSSLRVLFILFVTSIVTLFALGQAITFAWLTAVNSQYAMNDDIHFRFYAYAVLFFMFVLIDLWLAGILLYRQYLKRVHQNQHE